MNLNINISTLENGLRIVTENAPFKKVAMGVYVGTGLIHENVENNGMSHFLEHMAFKGTKTRTQQELSNMIESLGGNMNAHTSFSHTFYKANMLPQNWKVGMEFLSDIVQNSIFPLDEIEKERNVILQEIAMYNDNPGAVLSRIFDENAFAGQALGRPILGPAENIENFQRADFVKFVEDNYVANNMIVSVCGPVSHDEVVEYVTELFGSLNSKELASPESNSFSVVNVVAETSFEQAHVYIATEIPGYTDEKSKYTFALFNNILDGGMSCRLFQTIRETHGLAYSVSASGHLTKDLGIFGIYAAVDPADVEKTIAACRGVLETMKIDISDEDFEKARNTIEYGHCVSYDSCGSLMFRNASQLAKNGKIASYEETLEKVRAITKQDVLDYAKKYLTGEYATAVIIPEKE